MREGKLKRGRQREKSNNVTTFEWEEEGAVDEWEREKKREIKIDVGIVFESRRMKLKYKKCQYFNEWERGKERRRGRGRNTKNESVRMCVNV